MPRKGTRPTIDRLMEKVQITDTCWLWTGTTVRNGYGNMSVPGKVNAKAYVHRITYEHFVGPIPEGLQLDHLCRVRACCNPDHLEPVTGDENARRQAAVVTHCPNGHAYDEANTYVYTHHKHGWTMRFCRTCGREKAKAKRDTKSRAACP